MFSTHRELPFGESFIEIGRVLQEMVFARSAASESSAVVNSSRQRVGVLLDLLPAVIIMTTTTFMLQIIIHTNVQYSSRAPVW